MYFLYAPLHINIKFYQKKVRKVIELSSFKSGICQYNKITTGFEKLETAALLSPGTEPAGAPVAVSFTAARLQLA